MLYLIGIVGNFLLLVYAVILIVGISSGWLDRELWLHSDVAKIAQLLLINNSYSIKVLLKHLFFFCKKWG